MADTHTIERFDPSGMHKVYNRWPEIARSALESGAESTDLGSIDHIVFAGMGGSGTVGDLFSAVLSKTGTHVTVVKGYLLPMTVGPDTLIVCTSVSGDTAETLAVARAAIRRNCKLVCFASDGRLERFCRENSVPFRKVQSYLNPRSSFPSYVYSMIGTLDAILPVGAGDIEESLHMMSELRDKICTTHMDPGNPSYELALWMRKIPIIYYPWGLQAAAIRFKNSIQENMKSHAMTEDVIEASHNGIVAWEGGSGVCPVIVSGQDDYVTTRERWKVLREFFASREIDYREVRSENGSILTKIVNLIYMLDFATIYGSVLRGTDPYPVRPIDFVKERI